MSLADKPSGDFLKKQQINVVINGLSSVYVSEFDRTSHREVSLTSERESDEPP